MSAKKSKSSLEITDRDFTLTRIFLAPPRVVWETWTNPMYVAQWWGPHNFTNPVCEIDLRKGGKYRFVMRGPNHIDYPMNGVFTEIVKFKRLVMTINRVENPKEWQDEVKAHDGKGPVDEGEHTTVFEKVEGGTRVTVRARFVSAAKRNAMVKMGMNEGWSQSMERLMYVLVGKVDSTKKKGHEATYGNGKICYLQIPATDIKQSMAFYKKVFGWQTRTRGDGSIAFDDGVGQVSGTWVTGRKPSTTPGLLLYVMMDSVVATLKTVAKSGGEVVQPIGADAPEITARISDPAGNVIGLYQQPK